MQGEAALRACLTGLVLLNLVFVQLTEATSFAWLAPLYVLTALSPLLLPYRERFAYRALWNAGVLLVFAVLVRHATGDDLRYVLEDGLVLAALCQVHLLNNLRSDQRPDLLFLNSFLIAIITGYLCRDLTYGSAFLLYVPLFIIALELQAILRHGSALPPRETRAIVADGGRRAAVLLVATLLVFVFWPRDFERRGLLTGNFEFKSPAESFAIGFSDELKLDSKKTARASDRIVMRAHLERGSSAAVPPLWRGATLGSTNGEDWYPASESAEFGMSFEDAWTQRGSRFARSGAEPEQHALRIAVEHVDAEANVLFVPLEAVEVQLGQGADDRRVHVLSGGILRYGEPLFVRPSLHYDVRLEPSAASLGGPRRDPAEVARHVALPHSPKLAGARALAAELIAELAPDAEQHALVAKIAGKLTNDYEYMLPGTDGAAANLSEFLAGDAGGHCEFFASGLAAMLRSVHVPCRLVTGYRSEEWDPDGRVLTFRRRHAHAWVEVLDPTGGWYAVDPTPPASLLDSGNLWSELYSAVSLAWADFTSFDDERRARVYGWLAGLPGRTRSIALEHPLSSAATLALLAAWIVTLRRRARLRTQPGVLLYRRALRRARLVLAPGETPRELLDRARGLELAAPRLDALEQATQVHERERYALHRALAPEARGRRYFERQRSA